MLSMIVHFVTIILKGREGKGNGIFQREGKVNLRLLFPGMAGNGNYIKRIGSIQDLIQID